MRYSVIVEYAGYLFTQNLIRISALVGLLDDVSKNVDTVYDSNEWLFIFFLSKIYPNKSDFSFLFS